MLQAADEDAIAVSNPSSSAGSVDVVKRQLEPREEEDVEHVNRLTNRQLELAHCPREEHDRLAAFLLLLGPCAVKAGVCSEVADGLIVR